MLVVGDTWCAITDPLRYHSRVSGLKSWVLIAATWFVSILFCIASALRRDCRLITTEITSSIQMIRWTTSNDETTAAGTADTGDGVVAMNRTTSMLGDSLGFDDIYNLIYSCTFFVVIILLPICLVCAMYWKIFSEARQNGLRMRQNGSSPLLQSALNLATASAQIQPTHQLDHSFTVIGEEDSDHGVDSLTSSRSNVMHITMRRNSMATTTSPIHHHVIIKDPATKASTTKLQTLNSHRRYLDIPKFNEIQNYQIQRKCLRHGQSTTDTSSDDSSHTNEIKTRNLLFGHRHMYDAIAVDSSRDLRQVHSTPDLQKSIHFELMLLASDDPIVTSTAIDKKLHSTGSIHKHATTITPAQPRRTSFCAPPKALSYMTSIRHRLSNASSIFKYREESRAARISILVVIMFLFSYFPYGLLVLLQGRATFYANSSCLGVLFLLIANISSPFIFAYRNRRVRRGVCRLFGVDAKTNERLQKQRALLHGNLRSNSCRERKQKAKIVRINRNSMKSASISGSGALSQCKYSPVSLTRSERTKSTGSIAKLNETVESAVLLDRNNSTMIVPIIRDSTQTTVPLHRLSSLHCNGNVLVNAIDQYSDSNSCFMPDQSDTIDDASMAKYAKDIVNNINSAAADANCNGNGGSVGKSIHLNRTKNGACNLSSATGANVIKQKISLLRRVCKTQRKNTAAVATTIGIDAANAAQCNVDIQPPSSHNHNFIDTNTTSKPVNV